MNANTGSVAIGPNFGAMFIALRALKSEAQRDCA